MQAQVSDDCNHQVYRLVDTHDYVLSSRHMRILKAHDFQRVCVWICYILLIGLLIVNPRLPIDQSYGMVFFGLLDKVLVVDVGEIGLRNFSTKSKSCLLIMAAI